jgi:16S rRNA (uracil1498-N3)-methyltransferase
MKIHRFYIGHVDGADLHTDSLEKSKEVSILSKELAHQMEKVLRLRIGEMTLLFNGDGHEYLSRIVSFSKKGEITVHVESVTRNNISSSKELFLFFSLIKKDNIDWILQKGTELGITHFIPIISSRSEKKDINTERATKILIEASEQCGRGTIPQLHSVMKLEETFNTFDFPFIAFERGNEALSKEDFVNETSLGLLIGPEGGWTPEELEMFRNKKATFRSLGETVLRAETAAIAASSLLLL